MGRGLIWTFCPSAVSLRSSLSSETGVSMWLHPGWVLDGTVCRLSPTLTWTDIDYDFLWHLDSFEIWVGEPKCLWLSSCFAWLKTFWKYRDAKVKAQVFLNSVWRAKFLQCERCINYVNSCVYLKDYAAHTALLNSVISWLIILDQAWCQAQVVNIDGHKFANRARGHVTTRPQQATKHNRHRREECEL